MTELTHVDSEGRARMVDVSAKAETTRIAVAAGELVTTAEVVRLVRADGGNMHQPPHARRQTRRDQGARSIDVGGEGAVAAAILQYADAVHHRIHAVQYLLPGLGRDQS